MSGVRDMRGDFADRVMAAVGDEPRPSPTRSFIDALRARSLGDAVAAFRVALHLATVRRWSVGPRVRVQALALVLGILVALGVGSIAAAGAMSLVATGVNELGNVINNQFGTDEQGSVDNPGPNDDASEQGGDAGATDAHPSGPKDDRPGDGQLGDGHDDTDGTSGTDASDGPQDSQDVDDDSASGGQGVSSGSPDGNDGAAGNGTGEGRDNGAIGSGESDGSP